MSKSKSNMMNLKKCIKCGETNQHDLWYEPMVLLGLGEEEDYILCGYCLKIEYEE